MSMVMGDLRREQRTGTNVLGELDVCSPLQQS
jgi:hypothetical protein